jgi:hypothetical protein
MNRLVLSIIIQGVFLFGLIFQQDSILIEAHSRPLWILTNRFPVQITDTILWSIKNKKKHDIILCINMYHLIEPYQYTFFIFFFCITRRFLAQISALASKRSLLVESCKSFSLSLKKQPEDLNPKLT